MTIIQTIIFEFDNMLYLFSMFPPKKTLLLRTFKLNFALKEIHKMVKKKLFQSKIIYRYVSSCPFYKTLNIKKIIYIKKTRLC